MLLLTQQAFAEDAELLRAASICESHRSPSRFAHSYSPPWNEVCVPLRRDFDALYAAGRPKPKAAIVPPETTEVIAARQDRQTKEKAAFEAMTDSDKKAFAAKKREDMAEGQKAAMAARLTSDGTGRQNADYEFLKAKVLREGKALPEWWNGR